MEKLYPLFKIAELIAKENTGSLSDSEKTLLERWLTENPQNEKVYKKLQDESLLAGEISELEVYDAKKAFIKVERKIENENIPVKTFRLIPTYWKYAAAIAVLLVSTYFAARYLVQPKTTSVAESHIVAGKQKAILVTSNNQQIELDSSASKQLYADEYTQVVQKKSTLNYTSIDSLDADINKEIAYNTLITPMGGEYTVILSDGSEVMLNAGSSLKYPVVFSGNTREVMLEGEAFFKVAKSKSSSFLVKTNQITTIVYGTEFNVSVYGNDELVQTTLIEGSVGISINSSNTSSELKIKSGQQYIYDKGTRSVETKEVDTELYIAWTKGMFVFENEPIDNILKVMSRWYDFKFEFKDDNLKDQRFTISIGRYDHVSKILDLISASSELKFEAREGTIIISQKK